MIRFARSDDLHIAYDMREGNGSPLLLVSDGFVPIDSMEEEPSFARCLRRLNSFSRLILFDRRGVGLSDPVSPSAPPSLEDWMNDALAVLDTCGVAEAAVLASTETAMIAMLLAASHPGRVSRLVLVNCLARATRAPDYPIGYAPEDLESLLDGLLDPDPDAGAVDVLEIVGPSVASDPGFRDWWERAGRRGASPATAQAFMRSVLETDMRAVLPSIATPTLVLHRRGDRAVPSEHSRFVADHVPGARFAEIPGDDDLWWVGDTDSLLDEIEEFLVGTRPPANVERLLRTLVFTDIVDSTAQAVEKGDQRWRDVLDTHEAMVRRQLERYGGREVKTLGDGFLAIFDGPARAIRCCQAIQQGSSQLGIPVRAGIHTGEVEVRGEDVAGIAVHIAARVAAAAAREEVLVSRTVTDLVAGSGIGFDDRGEHELKGVPGPWRLFAVEG
jgi:class 3 adenylate cyclase